MEFLTNRAESMDEGTATTAATITTASPQAATTQRQQDSRAPHQSHGASGDSRNAFKRVVKCSLCGSEHQLFSCNTFKRLPLEQMWKRVRHAKVCENCLKPKCTPDKCKLGPCRYCGAKHNGLLCSKKEQPTMVNTSITANTSTTAAPST